LGYFLLDVHLLQELFILLILLHSVTIIKVKPM
jgi:hypothetical protein